MDVSTTQIEVVDKEEVAGVEREQTSENTPSQEELRIMFTQLSSILNGLKFALQTEQKHVSNENEIPIDEGNLDALKEKVAQMKQCQADIVGKFVEVAISLHEHIEEISKKYELRENGFKQREEVMDGLRKTIEGLHENLSEKEHLISFKEQNYNTMVGRLMAQHKMEKKQGYGGIDSALPPTMQMTFPLRSTSTSSGIRGSKRKTRSRMVPLKRRGEPNSTIIVLPRRVLPAGDVDNDDSNTVLPSNEMDEVEFPPEYTMPLSATTTTTTSATMHDNDDDELTDNDAIAYERDYPPAQDFNGFPADLMAHLRVKHTQRLAQKKRLARERKRLAQERGEEYEPEEPVNKRKRQRRGKLPEHATVLLKKWLFEHWWHPYPTEEEKEQLGVQTALEVTQVNNWFTNARRRILPKQTPVPMYVPYGGDDEAPPPHVMQAVLHTPVSALPTRARRRGNAASSSEYDAYEDDEE